MQDFQGMWKPWLLSKYKDSPKGVLEEHISCEFLLSTTSAKKSNICPAAEVCHLSMRHRGVAYDK